MAWPINAACVLEGLIALRLIWEFLTWLGVQGSWPGDPGGSI